MNNVFKTRRYNGFPPGTNICTSNNCLSLSISPRDTYACMYGIIMSNIFVMGKWVAYQPVLNLHLPLQKTKTLFVLIKYYIMWIKKKYHFLTISSLEMQNTSLY